MDKWWNSSPIDKTKTSPPQKKTKNKKQKQTLNQHLLSWLMDFTNSYELMIHIEIMEWINDYILIYEWSVCAHPCLIRCTDY